MEPNRKYLLRQDPTTGQYNITYPPGYYVFCKQCEKRFKKDLKKYFRKGKMFWATKIKKTDEPCFSCKNEYWQWYEKDNK